MMDCQNFANSELNNTTPTGDSEDSFRVVRVLEATQELLESLESDSAMVEANLNKRSL
jgi:hypothetical protein